MRHFIIFISIALLLTACNNLTSRDKYQIVASTDGNVYRLNKASGEILQIRGNTMERLQTKYFRLKIGHRYVGEDVYSFTYLGKGLVGEIKTLSDFELDKK